MAVRLTAAAALRYAPAMLAVISPAKSLDYERTLPPALDITCPAFADDADRLARSAARLSAKKLGALMHISPELSKLNVERFRTFADAPERPALFAFAGDVYVGFDVHSLDPHAIDFAQDHLRILSGLYGLLRPLDAIRPYRLGMGTKWAPRRKDLYDYWRGRIAEMLVKDADGPIINLASQEYWGAVDGRFPPGQRVIDIDFREHGPKGLRFNSFAAKRARGMMARYICEHRLSDPEALKGFDTDGYRFVPEESEPDRWRFTRT